MASATPKSAPRRSKGFRHTASLVETKMRQAGETRGFAVTKLLTHWSEIAGPGMAEVCTPVKVSYAHKGFGATLTVLTTGAQAQMLEMQLPRLRERVNACYGYNAISRVRITQTAPIGFAEGQAQFGHKPKPAAPKRDPKIQEKAQVIASDIQDESLRAALAAFGENIIMRDKRG